MLKKLLNKLLGKKTPEPEPMATRTERERQAEEWKRQKKSKWEPNDPVPRDTE